MKEEILQDVLVAGGFRTEQIEIKSVSYVISGTISVGKRRDADL